MKSTRCYPLAPSLALAGLFFATVSILTVSSARAASGVHGHALEAKETGAIAGLLPGAKIEFLDESGAIAGTAQSDTHGYYRVALPPGVYAFRVSASGFRSEDAGRGLAVHRNDGYVLQDFALVRGSTPSDSPKPAPADGKIGQLTGRVAGVDPDGKIVAVPAAQIFLRRVSSRELRVVTISPPTKAKSVGTYEVRLPAGEWRAAVTASGYERYVEEKTVAIQDGKKTEHHFTLHRSKGRLPERQGIRGVIELSDSSVAAASPSPIEVRVSGVKTSGPYPRRFSLKGPGEFEQNLPEGVYRLVAHTKGFRPATSRGVLVVKGSYTPVKLRLTSVEPASEPQSAKIVVRVLREDRDGKRVPLADAVVMYRREKEPPQRVTTDDQGTARWDITNVPPGGASLMLVGRKEGVGLQRSEQVAVPGRENTFELVLRDQPVSGGPDMGGPGPVPEKPPVREPRVVKYTGFAVERVGEAPIGVPGTRVTFTPLIDPATFAGWMSRFLELDANHDGFLTDGELNRFPPTVQKRIIEEAKGKPRLDLRQFVLLLVGFQHQTDLASASPSPSNQSATAETKGQFELELTENAYRVQVDAPPGFRGAEQRLVVTNLVRDQFVYVERSERPQPQTVQLQVDVERQRYRVEGGRPVPYVERPKGVMVLLQTADGKFIERNFSSNSGSVTFRAAPGQYQLVADAADLGKKSQAVSVQDDTRVLFTYSDPMPSEETLTIRVVAEDIRQGASSLGPVAGARVTIMQEGRRVAGGLADERGLFVAQLHAGPYEVAAETPGYQDGRAEVFIKGSTRSTVTLRRDLPARPAEKLGLFVIVHEAGNERLVLSGATVVAVGRTGSTTARFLPILNYFRAEVPPGRYRLTVSHPGYQSYEQAIAVSDSAPTTATVTLKRQAVAWDRTPNPTTSSIPPGNAPSGPRRDASPRLVPVEIRTSVDYRGEFGKGPLAGATIQITRGGRSVASGTSDAQGVFRTQLESSAQYEVLVKGNPALQLTPVSQPFYLGGSYSTEITLGRALPSGPPRGASRKPLPVPPKPRLPEKPTKPKQSPLF